MSILCIGELLIDFISQNIGNGTENSELYLKKAGGAPANVSAVIAKLGGKSYFAGKVGDDGFGRFLEQKLTNFGVDCSLLVKEPQEATTLAFVTLESDGERDFSFIRGADAKYKFSEFDKEILKTVKIIHFGSATGFLEGELKETYCQLLDYAKNNGKIVSFDPNYREFFWKENVVEFINDSMNFIKNADIVKVSEEELYLLTNQHEFKGAIDYLHKEGAKLIAVTLGKNGTYISNGRKSELIPSIKIESIDSTGAGDAFIGSLLYYIEENSYELNDFDLIKDYVLKANIIAAKTCTKMGALEALEAIK